MLEVTKLSVSYGGLRALTDVSLSVKEGQFVTKIRKVFSKRECDADLVFVPATLFRQKDDMEYFTMLPTSPP